MGRRALVFQLNAIFAAAGGQFWRERVRAGCTDHPAASSLLSPPSTTNSRAYLLTHRAAEGLKTRPETEGANYVMAFWQPDPIFRLSAASVVAFFFVHSNLLFELGLRLWSNQPCLQRR